MADREAKIASVAISLLREFRIPALHEALQTSCPRKYSRLPQGSGTGKTRRETSRL
jgi:hypothetical protein